MALIILVILIVLGIAAVLVLRARSLKGDRRRQQDDSKR
jgi:uncharacterized membrane protein